MPYITERGRYLAMVQFADLGTYPKDADESQKKPVFSLKLEVNGKYDYKEKKWQSLSEICHIYSNNYLVNKDGTLNDSKLKQLKTAFPGLEHKMFREEFGAFADAEFFVGKSLQFDAKESEYQGRKRVEVSWLHHEDDDPGKANADPSQFSRFSSMLRATCSAKAEPAPTPDPETEKDLPF